MPVLRGSSRPLPGQGNGQVFPYAHHFHGLESGLSRRLPEPGRRPAAGGCGGLPGGQLDAAPGQVHLAALGPLTNLARLERQRPGSLAQAASIVVMGGAVDAPGNSTPYAEFNFLQRPGGGAGGF